MCLWRSCLTPKISKNREPEKYIKKYMEKNRSLLSSSSCSLPPASSSEIKICKNRKNSKYFPKNIKTGNFFFWVHTAAKKRNKFLQGVFCYCYSVIVKNVILFILFIHFYIFIKQKTVLQHVRREFLWKKCLNILHCVFLWFSPSEKIINRKNGSLLRVAGVV